VTAFGGAAKQYLALASGALDLSLSSGPGMVFITKGMPVKAVAAVMGRPYLVVVVPFDSPARTIDDLKGKNIGVAAISSVTDRAMKEIGRKKKWRPADVNTVAIGGDLSTTTAALITHQVDGIVEAMGSGYQMEEKKIDRVVGDAGDYIDDFIMHVVFATNDFITANPDAVRRVLKAWFETIEWMLANPDEALRMTAKVTGYSPNVAKRELDAVMPTFSRDGCFDPKALAMLSKSFVDAGQIDKEPDMSALFTEQFLPGK
jgi:ABC-type nitrate/sulfonate/bicarbonate transport system substrate-binding protein